MHHALLSHSSFVFAILLVRQKLLPFSNSIKMKLLGHSNRIFRTWTKSKKMVCLRSDTPPRCLTLKMSAKKGEIIRLPCSQPGRAVKSNERRNSSSDIPCKRSSWKPSTADAANKSVHSTGSSHTTSVPISLSSPATPAFPVSNALTPPLPPSPRPSPNNQLSHESSSAKSSQKYSHNTGLPHTWAHKRPPPRETAGKPGPLSGHTSKP